MKYVFLPSLFPSFLPHSEFLPPFSFSILPSDSIAFLHRIYVCFLGQIGKLDWGRRTDRAHDEAGWEGALGGPVLGGKR